MFALGLLSKGFNCLGQSVLPSINKKRTFVSWRGFERLLIFLSPPSSFRNCFHLWHQASDPPLMSTYLCLSDLWLQILHFAQIFFQHSQQYYLSNNIITWKWKLLFSMRNIRAVFRFFLLSIWLYSIWHIPIWIITIFHDSFDNHPWIHNTTILHPKSMGCLS